MKKHILKVLITQLLLIILFSYALYLSRPASQSKITRINITVSQIQCEPTINEHILCIYSNDGKYIFPNLGPNVNWSRNELNNEIKVGDELTISYIRSYTVLGIRNWIVECENQSVQYRSMEEYNKQHDGLFVIEIFLFVLVEVLYFSLLFLLRKLKIIHIR